MSAMENLTYRRNAIALGRDVKKTENAKQIEKLLEFS